MLKEDVHNFGMGSPPVAVECYSQSTYALIDIAFMIQSQGMAE
jgi:hypothetical protein